MERDLRQTPLFQEIEAFYRSALEPGFGRPTTFGNPVVSPDGAWVVVAGSVRTSLDADAQGRLFMVPAAGGAIRQVTYGPDDDAGPQWSPDGMRLTFRQPPPLKCFSDQFLLYLNTSIADTAYHTWAGMSVDAASSLPPERFHFDVVNMSLQ